MIEAVGPFETLNLSTKHSITFQKTIILIFTEDVTSPDIVIFLKSQKCIISVVSDFFSLRS